MDASVLSALSALGGAIIGGLTSLLASFSAQRSQARVQWISQDRTRRQEVYKEFIEDAPKCYADALEHDEADIPTGVWPEDLTIITRRSAPSRHLRHASSRLNALVSRIARTFPRGD